MHGLTVKTKICHVLMPNFSADIKFGGLFVQQEFVSNKIPSKSKCICR